MGFNNDIVQDYGSLDILSGHCGGQALPYSLCRIDPRLKIIGLISIVALNVVVAKLWLSASLLTAGLFMALWSRIPLKKFLFF